MWGERGRKRGERRMKRRKEDKGGETEEGEVIEEENNEVLQLMLNPIWLPRPLDLLLPAAKTSNDHLPGQAFASSYSIVRKR